MFSILRRRRPADNLKPAPIATDAALLHAIAAELVRRGLFAYVSPSAVTVRMPARLVRLALVTERPEG